MPNFGLCIALPDGITMDDVRTGEPVIRERTERKVPVRPRPLPAPA